MKLDFFTRFFRIGQSSPTSKVIECEKTEATPKEKQTCGAFQLQCNNPSILEDLKIGDNLNLYTRSDLDDIKIYTIDSIGGDGFIGFVPAERRFLLRNHLLNTHSNFGTKTILASIAAINGTNIKIDYQLISQDEIYKVEMIQLTDFIQARKAELNKVYKMKAPVKLEFFDFDFSRINEEFTLGFQSKDWYIQNPLKYPIQLLARDRSVISETHSQKSVVDRILKTHFNGNKIEITGKAEKNGRLVLTIAPSSDA